MDVASLCVLLAFLIIVYRYREWIFDQAGLEMPEGMRPRPRQSPKVSQRSLLSNFERFPDQYTTLEDVHIALRNCGLESCNLILGIDYTASNATQGRDSFDGKSLHDLSGPPNPYQQVISALGRTLAGMDEDGQIPVYGFGDLSSKDHKVFSFFSDRPCEGFHEVLDRYKEITPDRVLSGPTNFAPLIEEAVKVVKATGRMQYHILVIVADGQVTNEDETAEAIRVASSVPLSIVLVGVGDGPWDMMRHFDDRLGKRQFDNFQFVDHHAVTRGSSTPDVAFALHALQEIPQQYAALRALKLVGKQC